MASDIGVKIGLEGEKQFKSALSEINQAFKVLGSEMKLVASQFDKNDSSMQALTARNQVLNKEIETQKQKIEVLRQALQNAADSFGETDRRTQSWQIQLNNAEAALNDMERELKANNDALEASGENSEDAAKGMDELSEAADDVDENLDDIADSADDAADGLDDTGDSAEDSKKKFENLGKTLKAVGAALGAVVVAAAGAAVKLGQAVVENYADYEQLIGGVKTLFGTEASSVEEYAKSVGKSVDEVQSEYDSLIAAQTEVMRNADNAYKTAGLSANEYMETVTAFSASLIASLDGDTEAAASKADQAIHNRFDIEVVDAATGKVKQKAYAENIILNQLWTANFWTYAWFKYIHYGTGTSTPTATDTRLDNFYAAVQAGSLSWGYTADTVWAKKSIQLACS